MDTLKQMELKIHAYEDKELPVLTLIALLRNEADWSGKADELNTFGLQLTTMQEHIKRFRHHTDMLEVSEEREVPQEILSGMSESLEPMLVILSEATERYLGILNCFREDRGEAAYMLPTSSTS